MTGEFCGASSTVALRNVELVSPVFDGLAATAEDVPDDILTAYLDLFDGLADGERHDDLMEEVIFGGWQPANATEFVQRFIAVQTGD